MRTVFLIPLTLGVAVVAGCGAEGREQVAPSAPRRDLTLRTQAAGVEVASAVELQPLRARHQTARPSQPTVRPALARRSSSKGAEAILAVVAPAPALLPVSQPAVVPASTTEEAASDRELLPGKTVTLIPASSGPSTAPDVADDFPTVRGASFGGRGGGHCPPRRGRPGIGIATGPRPDFR